MVADTTIHQWEAEARRFLQEPIEIHIVGKTKDMNQLAKRLQTSLRPKHQHLIIISMSQLDRAYKHASEPEAQGQPSHDFFQLDFLAAYVDELHFCRNDGHLLKAVHSLTGRAALRLGLTATPLPTKFENILNEARAIHMDGSANEEAPRRIQAVDRVFRKEGAVGGGRTNLPEEEAEATSIVGSVRNLLFRSVLRRTTNSLDDKGRPLVDLPKCTVHRVDIEMNKHEENELKEAAREDAESKLVGDGDQRASCRVLMGFI